MLVLNYNGEEYSSFKRISAIQSLESLPCYAILDFNDDISLIPGKCTLSFGKTTFIQGMAVSSEEINCDRGTRKALVIADNSYIASESDSFGREWEGANLSQIAGDIVSPFNLSIKTDSNPTIKVFSCHPSESVFDKLDQLADITDQFLLSDGNGQIIFKKKQINSGQIDKDLLESTKLNRFFIKKRINIYSHESSQIHNKTDGFIVKNYILNFGEYFDIFLESKERVSRYSGNTMEAIFRDGSSFLEYNIGDTVTMDSDTYTIFKKSYVYDEEKGERMVLDLRSEK